MGLIANLFGIYCLHKQRGGNVNQRILLQNLSVVEIIKIIYDYISITTFYECNDWYHDHGLYIDIIEVNILTVFFSCFILISGERLACIKLGVRYNTHVTKSLIIDIVFTTWIFGFTSGLFLWASQNLPYRVYYYVVCDILVIVLNIITYISIGRFYHETRGRLFNGSRRNVIKELKMLLVPFLIISTFVVCNGIPDLVFVFSHTPESYQVMIIMWALGFVMDPTIYILMSKKTRTTAKKTSKTVIQLTNLFRDNQYSQRKSTMRKSRRKFNKAPTNTTVNTPLTGTTTGTATTTPGSAPTTRSRVNTDASSLRSLKSYDWNETDL